ncbi:MAG: RNA polymerase sigma factor [Ruminococcus sp.]
MENKNGTEFNFEKVIDEFSNMVYRVAYNYLSNKSESEDIMQEVFLSLLKKGTDNMDYEHLKAWLIRVTINKCKNINKSSWNSKTVPLEEAENILTQEELSLRDELFALEKTDRSIVYLYYYEQLTIKEISKILHMKSSSVGTRLSRARKKLKFIIEQEEIQ